VKESPVFRALLESAAQEGDDIIPLTEVTWKDFEILLDFYYEGYVLGVHEGLSHMTNLHLRMHDDHDFTIQDWVILLTIASQFDFSKLRERAIREIDSYEPRSELRLLPVQKIVLAQKYDIPKWLRSCYEALCARTRGLDNEEADLLGIQTTNCIWKARELLREETHHRPVQQRVFRGVGVWNLDPEPHTHNFNPSTVSEVVQRVFWPPDPLQRRPSLQRSLTPEPETKTLPLPPAGTITPLAPLTPLPQPAPPRPIVTSPPKSPTSLLSGLGFTSHQTKVSYFEKKKRLKKKKHDTLRPTTSDADARSPSPTEE
jgi:hypothetical protein